MDGFEDAKSMKPAWAWQFESSRPVQISPQQLTLSPHMSLVQQPVRFGAFSQQTFDSKPVLRASAPSSAASMSHVASNSRRRQPSVSSDSSRSPKRRKGEYPASCPSSASPGSPAPSVGEQISQMSAAPFASALPDISSATPFALGSIAEEVAHGECLACGYRYVSVEQLADHQRIYHGLAEVIF